MWGFATICEKRSGFQKPTKVNEAVFLLAVDEMADASRKLFASLETNAEPKNRAEMAAKAQTLSAQRFSK
jgi:hypothetical protein